MKYLLICLLFVACSHSQPKVIPKEDLAVTHPELFAPVHTYMLPMAHSVKKIKYRSVKRCLDQEGKWLKGCQ